MTLTPLLKYWAPHPLITGTYAFIDTGTIGTDAIKVAFIYQPATVTPIGAYAILDASVDPTFIDTKNRPTLAQTFTEIATGETLTVAVNHLKSKGSNCDALGDPDTGDGQGNCSDTRADAATALVNWLTTDPTNSGDLDFLIIGDLNSYAMEDAITNIESAGYTNLIESFGGASAYSYVYSGEAGYLDHALSSTSLTPYVTGVTEWHINADEPRALDYNEEYKSAGQVVSLYASDSYRASDHDPVLIGLNLVTIVPPTAIPPSTSAPQIGVFDPAISKIGLLLPGELGVVGEQAEWIVTVSNTGSAAGTDVVVMDTLVAELQIDSVDAPGAIVDIIGQTVTVTYSVINPGEAFQFSIFTTMLGGTNVSNLACVVGYDACSTGMVARQLPATGEIPDRTDE